MLNLERIRADDRLMRSMTGLNRQSFKELLPSFEEAYYSSLQKAKPFRLKAVGGGRTATLKTVEDKLLYILVYYKCYPTFDLMGIMFDLGRSGAHYWVHKLTPVIEEALGQKQVLPERKIGSITEFLKKFSDVSVLIVDGTERPIQRPKNSKEQKKNYSGKKNAIRESILQVPLVTKR
jgi:Helix-turn-helix of DDE superfamily endonuclease